MLMHFLFPPSASPTAMEDLGGEIEEKISLKSMDKAPKISGAQGVTPSAGPSACPPPAGAPQPTTSTSFCSGAVGMSFFGLL